MNHWSNRSATGSIGATAGKIGRIDLAQVGDPADRTVADLFPDGSERVAGSSTDSPTRSALTVRAQGTPTDQLVRPAKTYSHGASRRSKPPLRRLLASRIAASKAAIMYQDSSLERGRYEALDGAPSAHECLQPANPESIINGSFLNYSFNFHGHRSAPAALPSSVQEPGRTRGPGGRSRRTPWLVW